MTPDDWIVACDSVLNSQQISVDELACRLRPTSAYIENLMRRCDPRSQSGTETLARLRLRAQGFAVVVQPQIDAYRTDRRRDRSALTRGWLTMRLTYDDVLFGWDDVLTVIRAITDADRHRTRRNRTHR